VRPGGSDVRVKGRAAIAPLAILLHEEEPSVPVHPVERKLAAIFAADIAGYSRLMARDEVGTLGRLKACRVIIDGLIASHRGRIFNTAGDSVVADFASAVDAVQCAVAVQAAIVTENAGGPDDEPMQFRIGVHVGDVMVDGENLLGDGVNIAARLEALAEPGAIYVSAAAHGQIGNKLPLAFDDLGEQLVKNIPQAIRVYRVQTEKPAVQPFSSLPLPDKPSIAVLPFQNMSGDPEQEYFADGMVEEIITALSRYPSLFVIARNSCFTYKGRAVEIRQVGRELGVRYVLEGSLRKSGNRIRVTAQLVEAETGNHVWAERYDRDLTDIFAVQDEISAAVTVSIAPAIAGAEQHRAIRKPPESLDAWAAYQRGLWHFCKASAEDNRLAREFFQRAIDLDPNFAASYSGLASAQCQAATTYGTLSLPETLRSAEVLARRSVDLDSDNADAHAQLSNVLWHRGDHEAALTEAQRALAISPNLASAHQILGSTLVFYGRREEGLRALLGSIRHDPYTPRLAARLAHIAAAHYFNGAYEAAVEAAKTASRSFPDYPLPYRWLAAALGQLGRVDEAKEALEKAIAIAPASFDQHTRNRMPWYRSEDHAHIVDGLRKAGWEG
jgi:adenylate cyclase